jgi:Fic family protein
MPIKFRPHFTITKAILKDIARADAAKKKVNDLPLTTKMLASLRESAKIQSAHYSTMMSGNRLNIEQVRQVIIQHKALEKESYTLLRQLDPKQRKALALFSRYDTIISAQLGKLFNFKPRTSSQLAHKWVQEGFLEILDSSKKGRKYGLARAYKKLLAIKSE